MSNFRKAYAMTIPFEFLEAPAQQTRVILSSFVAVLGVLGCIVAISAIHESKPRFRVAAITYPALVVLGLAIIAGSFYFGPHMTQKSAKESRATFIQELESTYAIDLGDRAESEIFRGVTPILDKPISLLLTQNNELYSLDVVLREVRENEYELLAVNGATQLVSIEEALATVDQVTNLTEVD